MEKLLHAWDYPEWIVYSPPRSAGEMTQKYGDVVDVEGWVDTEIKHHKYMYVTTFVDSGHVCSPEPASKEWSQLCNMIRFLSI